MDIDWTYQLDISSQHDYCSCFKFEQYQDDCCQVLEVNEMESNECKNLFLESEIKTNNNKNIEKHSTKSKKHKSNITE